MYNFLTKNGQSLAFGLGTVIVVLFLVNIFTGLSTFEALPEDQQDSTGIFNFGLSSAIALVIIAAIAMLLFGVFHVATNFKASRKGIIGLVVLAIIFFVSYTTDSGEVTSFIQPAVDKFKATGGVITADNLKFISGGITTVGVLMGIAVAAFVIAEIRNFFK